MKLRRRKLWGCLLACFLGLGVWYLLDQALLPRPFHVHIASITRETRESKGGQTILEKELILDSTGTWLAMFDSYSDDETSKVNWEFYDLCVAKPVARRVQWEHSSYHSVPIAGGMRVFTLQRKPTQSSVDSLGQSGPLNTKVMPISLRVDKRPADEESWKWIIRGIDCSFVDGTIHTRLETEVAGHKSISPLLYNKSGDIVVVLEPIPVWPLRYLAPGLLSDWDVLVLQRLEERPPRIHTLTTGDAVLAHVWNVKTGNRERSILFPPLNPTSFLLSPDGRWLVRPESIGPTNQVGLHLGISLISAKNGPLFDQPGVEAVQPAKPRGVVVCDLSNGEKKTILGDSRLDKYGVYTPGVENGAAILAYSQVLTYSSGSDGIVGYKPFDQSTMLDDGYLLVSLNDGRQYAWEHLLLGKGVFDILLSTFWGENRYVAKTKENGKECVGLVTLDEKVRFLYHPVSLAGSVLLHPLQPEGLVLGFTSFRPLWPQWLQSFCMKCNFDLTQQFPRDVVATLNVFDLPKSRVIFSHTITHKGQERDIECAPTHDGQAILLQRQAEDGLHLYRWQLPLSLWSPWWSRGMGVVMACLILWCSLRSRATCSPKCS